MNKEIELKYDNIDTFFQSCEGLTVRQALDRMYEGIISGQINLEYAAARLGITVRQLLDYVSEYQAQIGDR